MYSYLKLAVICFSPLSLSLSFLCRVRVEVTVRTLKQYCHSCLSANHKTCLREVLVQGQMTHSRSMTLFSANSVQHKPTHTVLYMFVNIYLLKHPIVCFNRSVFTFMYSVTIPLKQVYPYNWKKYACVRTSIVSKDKIREETVWWCSLISFFKIRVVWEPLFLVSKITFESCLQHHILYVSSGNIWTVASMLNKLKNRMGDEQRKAWEWISLQQSASCRNRQEINIYRHSPALDSIHVRMNKQSSLQS